QGLCVGGLSENRPQVTVCPQRSAKDQIGWPLSSTSSENLATALMASPFPSRSPRSPVAWLGDSADMPVLALTGWGCLSACQAHSCTGGRAPRASSLSGRNDPDRFCYLPADGTPALL